MDKIGFWGNFDKQKLFSFNNIKTNELCFFDCEEPIETVFNGHDIWIYFQKKDDSLLVSIPPCKTITIEHPQNSAEDCVNSLLSYENSLIGIDMHDIFTALGTGDSVFFLCNLSEIDIEGRKQSFPHIKGAYILFKFPENEETIFEKIENILSKIDECCDKETYIAYSVIIEHTIEKFMCDWLIARP